MPSALTRSSLRSSGGTVESVEKPASGSETEELQPKGLRRLRLRFRDRQLESEFRAQFYRHNLGNLRVTFLSGAALWVVSGLFLHRYILALSDQWLDRNLRYGVFIPMLLVGFGLSYARFFPRIWEWVAVGLAVATLLLWVYYVAHVLTLPPEYGYVGVILITSFTYALLRLRFVLVMGITAIGIAAYLPYAFTATYFADATRALATLYLLSFGGLGGVAAYRLERFTRRLFLRERQLSQEQRRSDLLLLNILPQAIVDRLKFSAKGERIVEALDEVSVLFIDAVGSTEQAARSSAEEFADTLDRLFRLIDELADRHGLEKIKTQGDAYMAVAGAPLPMPDHAAAAASMALEVVAAAGEVRWPSGDPISVRVGLATGPVVAGVIGRRKFAYDLWGDTVNLASRLQENGERGCVLASEPTFERLSHRFEFGPLVVLDLKGKGPTPARVIVAAQGQEVAVGPGVAAEAEDRSPTSNPSGMRLPNRSR
jgi:class 3 adenylate cyclase